MTFFALPATARTPKVELDADAAKLVLYGESYPEDVPSFYAQIQEALSAYFATHSTAFTVEIKLTYFNSSSARALMELLDMLDSQSHDERVISVFWYCDPDDDITREFALDISSDVSQISVELCDLDPHDES